MSAKLSNGVHFLQSQSLATFSRTIKTLKGLSFYQRPLVVFFSHNHLISLSALCRRHFSAANFPKNTKDPPLTPPEFPSPTLRRPFSTVHRLFYPVSRCCATKLKTTYRAIWCVVNEIFCIKKNVNTYMYTYISVEWSTKDGRYIICVMFLRAPEGATHKTERQNKHNEGRTHKRE